MLKRTPLLERPETGPRRDPSRPYSGRQEQVNGPGPGSLAERRFLRAEGYREPTVVIRISRNLFRKMLEGYPAAARRLRDMMAERLGGWTEDLAAISARMEPK